MVFWNMCNDLPPTEFCLGIFLQVESFAIYFIREICSFLTLVKSPLVAAKLVKEVNSSRLYLL
jgi:hypothetical protein